jgi:hypothetical protein
MWQHPSLGKPRSEGRTPNGRVNPPKRPSDSTGPGTYTETLTNVRIAILKENYHEDKLSEADTELLLAEIAGTIRMTSREGLP